MGAALPGFYEARFPVEAWPGRFREQFHADPRVTFYEVPMIGGMARLGKWFIDSGMRRGTPPADYEHVITVYRGTDAWKQRVGVDERDTAYLILLDRTGKVAWRHAGGLDGRRTRRWLPKFRSFLDQGSGKNNLSA